MTPFARKIVFFSSGGAFLDGYVLSIIGVALVQLTPALGLTDTQAAATGAAALAGIFFGSLVGGRLTDALGRRTMFILDVSAIAVASLAACFVGSAWQLIVLRLVLGFFIGADYPIATSLIAEFSPRAQRAVTMGTVSAAWYLGATAAAGVGFALYAVDGGWRWMLGSAVVPAVALLVGRRDIPESARWLAQRGRGDEAREVMVKVFGEGVELAPQECAPAGFRAVFRQGYLGRTVYLGLLILCQVVPMYAMYTFGPSIIAAFGLGQGSLSVLGEAAVSLFFLVGTIPAMYWLDSMGRRPLLIGSLALMAAGLLVPGIWPGANIVVVVLAFAVYAFFSGGPGILQWLYPNEMFPTEVRATAVGVAIAISRIGVVVSTYGLPLFLDAYGIGPTMLVGAGLLVVCLVLSVVMAPETRGLTLDETSSLRAGRPETGAQVADLRTEGRRRG
ncbi:MAG: MFS transporter [Cellulomonas sp.]|nr:MFS transporter [Cellulomonas sp.]